MTGQAYEVVFALKFTYAVPKYSFGNISFTPIKPKGAKKKAWQKRNARKGVSPSADGDHRTRVGSAVAFFKKRRKNFQTDLLYLTANPPIYTHINLMLHLNER